MIGASFTLVTVKLNVWKSVLIGIPVSDTVNVRLETPKPFATGLTVAVQFGAVPPKTTLATGINAVLVEAALIEVAQFKVLSISVIVKLITSGVSSGVV